ncbi:MAG: FAD-binding oxidoreductase, partial [Candidatus Magasanikbacteria bacterium]|nr:FAD-binding oxidoreductase [Candidatus Magasanikbacteria bacterium]
MHLVSELQSIISGDVSADEKILQTHSEDKSPFHITPSAVIFPKNSSDVQAIVKFVAKNKTEHSELSLTARSAGTDVTGGPLNESIIIDFTKYCNHILKIGALSASAVSEPGVFYRDFEIETLKHDLLLPSFPASRSICAIGGMVANNSGGEQTLAYGKTENFVTRLKVILNDGSECTFEALNPDQLAEKLLLETREGEIYRDIYKLISENYDILAAAKPQVSKNSAGYYLWNVWNIETQIFDLTKLFVGSQGTLGIITEMSFRLIHPKKEARLLAIFANDLDQIPEIVHSTLEFKPEIFEIYDRSVLKIIFRYFPAFIKMLGGNIFKIFRNFLPEISIIATSFRLPSYVLTAEFTGDNQIEVDRRAHAAAQALAKYNIKTHVTRDSEEAQKYKTIRRESFSLLQKHVRNRQTVTFIDDLIVPPEKLPEFIPRLRKMLDAYENISYSIIGHIGDGNMHVIPLMDLSDARTKDTINTLTREVNKLVIEFKGSITAEHNDGLTRSPFLREMYGDEIINLFEKA